MMSSYRMMFSAPGRVYFGSALTIGEDGVLRVCRAGEKRDAIAGEDLMGGLMVEVDERAIARRTRENPARSDTNEALVRDLVNDTFRLGIGDSEAKVDPSIFELEVDARPVLNRMVDPASAVDYRTLLARYMDHVGQCEGIDFTDRLNERMDSDVEFTEEEVTLLKSLSNPRFR